MPQRGVVTVFVAAVALEEEAHHATDVFLGNDAVDFDDALAQADMLAGQQGQSIKLDRGVELIEDIARDDVLGVMAEVVGLGVHVHRLLGDAFSLSPAQKIPSARGGRKHASPRSIGEDKIRLRSQLFQL